MAGQVGRGAFRASEWVCVPQHAAAGLWGGRQLQGPQWVLASGCFLTEPCLLLVFGLALSCRGRFVNFLKVKQNWKWGSEPPASHHLASTSTTPCPPVRLCSLKFFLFICFQVNFNYTERCSSSLCSFDRGIHVCSTPPAERTFQNFPPPACQPAFLPRLRLGPPLL